MTAQSKGFHQASANEAFLLNCWYVAAWDHELIDGKLPERTILGKPVAIYKGDSGRAVALDDRCCHRGAKLSAGRLEADPSFAMHPIVADAPLVHFRRTLARMIEEERAGPKAVAA